MTFRRSIDFILVYEEYKASSDGGAQVERPHHERHERWRTKFMGNLRKIGLDMEEVL